MKKILILAIALSLSACALPTTSVNTGAARPTLTILGAPAGAILFVDSLEIGVASKYDGASNTLLVEEGVHRVELRLNGKVLMAQKIFSSSGENSKFTYSAESAK